jgi:hypothetical protein
MKTAKEKAHALADELAVITDYGILCKRLALALKEQDRDTRHACADAVTKLRGQMGEGGDPFTAAGNACMNVRAV